MANDSALDSRCQRRTGVLNDTGGTHDTSRDSRTGRTPNRTGRPAAAHQCRKSRPNDVVPPHRRRPERQLRVCPSNPWFADVGAQSWRFVVGWCPVGRPSLANRARMRNEAAVVAGRPRERVRSGEDARPTRGRPWCADCPRAWSRTQLVVDAIEAVRRTLAEPFGISRDVDASVIAAGRGCSTRSGFVPSNVGRWTKLELRRRRGPWMGTPRSVRADDPRASSAWRHGVRCRRWRRR